MTETEFIKYHNIPESFFNNKIKSTACNERVLIDNNNS